MERNGAIVDRVVQLISRKIVGEILKQEEEELKRWRRASPVNDVLYCKLLDKCYLLNKYRVYLDVDVSIAEEKMRRRIERQTKRRVMMYWGVAVSVLLLFAMGGVFFISSEPAFPEHVPVCDKGKVRAVLMLSDGQMIPLNNQDNSVVLSGTGMGIAMDKETLVYSMKGDSVVSSENKLFVPNGGEFALLLSDGTKVWLNAGSELIYTTFFKDSVREVQLNGEAYFEVTRSEKPFVVRTAKMDVVVLGTSFNVTCYANDACAHATLKTGKVKVVRGSEEVVLEPGLQAYVSCDSMSVREVDLRPYVSWMGDRFYFVDEKLEMLMQKLERWYDVQVFYVNPALKDRYFSGSIPKYLDVKRVLEMLKMTTDVDFVINDKTIQVMEKFQ